MHAQTCPDPASKVPLLSVPPNAPFSTGLTADHVLEGPPMWAGQARQQRMIDARAQAAAESAAGADGADGAGAEEKEEKTEALPAEPMVGRAPKAASKPPSQQRLQVTVVVTPAVRKYDDGDISS